MPQRWQAVGLHANVFAFNRLHQRRDLRLLQVIHHARALRKAILEKPVAVIGVQNPHHHRMRHHRKTRHEIMLSNAKTRNAVEPIRNQLRPNHKIAHLPTLLMRRTVQVCLTALLRRRINQGDCFGIECHRQTQSLGYRLARVIVRRCAYTAGDQDGNRFSEAALEPFDQIHPIIAHIFDPRQTQASLGQQLFNRREMRIRTRTLHNLIANNHQTEFHTAAPLSACSIIGSVRAEASGKGCAFAVFARSSRKSCNACKQYKLYAKPQ